MFHILKTRIRIIQLIKLDKFLLSIRPTTNYVRYVQNIDLDKLQFKFFTFPKVSFRSPLPHPALKRS